MKQLFLIDGSGYIFRAYHALPPLTAPDGTPVGAVYGFCTMLRNLIAAHHMHHFLVVFDAGRQTFRQEIYKDYKAHRPPPPEDLIPQFALIREACEAFGVPAVEMQGFEADDLIASYARKAVAEDFDVTIVSADKDLMQLVSDKVKLFDPIKKKDIGVAQVIEKFGVPPHCVIDVQALAGDSADNVPGVPGIGIKTAAELIKTYQTLELLLASAQTIKQPKRRQSLLDHAQEARISKQLVTLVDSLELPLDFDSLFVRDLSVKAVQFLERLGFKTLMARVTAQLSSPHEGAADNMQQTVFKKTDPLSAGYKMLTQTSDIKNYFDKASDTGVVAFDIETTSLHIHDAQMVGFSMCFRDTQNILHSVYVPCFHQTTQPQANFDEVKPLLASFLKEPGVLKIGHNFKYDIAILNTMGFDVEPIEDTMLMSYCIDGGLHSHSMDYLAKYHLQRETLSFEVVCGKGKNQITFDAVDLETATTYAAEDAEVTLLLYEYLKPMLYEKNVLNLYYEIERPLIPCIVAMEREGIKIDTDELQKFGLELNERLAHLQEEIYQSVGHSFNIASPKQLGVVLFDEQGLPAPKTTKTGAYTTDSDVLEALVLKGYDLPQKILNWRSISKLLSTYVESLPNAICKKTGRIHTSYALSGTSTGRLASSDPNLQNIPIRFADGKRIRNAFIAEAGKKLISIDYSQIELRLLAHFADVPTLQEAFANAIDSHTFTASLLFDIPYGQVTTEQRRQAKTVNFGIIYGISSFGLANQLQIPQTAAAELIKAYLDRYPGIRDFMTQMKQEALDNGFVKTLFGRRCYTPGIHDKNPALRNFAQRQAVNAPLQGSNADIIKKAMSQLHQWIQKTKIDVKMLLQVHDELVFEIKDDPKVIELFTAQAKLMMENVCSLKVPLKVDVGIGNTWAQAHG